MHRYPSPLFTPFIAMILECLPWKKCRKVKNVQRIERIAIFYQYIAIYFLLKTLLTAVMESFFLDGTFRVFT
ncbi:MAG: hypothetical protein CSA33_03710 [Desulfobulbus propionicus]|nr:MAG: hypothetical protein CSA33_03710 [Desulfobulbus propionicus]